MNKLCRELNEAFEPILRVTALEGDVFPFDPSQFTQSIGEGRGRLHETERTRAQIADRVSLPGRLRARRQRPSRRSAAE